MSNLVVSEKRATLVANVLSVVIPLVVFLVLRLIVVAIHAATGDLTGVGDGVELVDETDLLLILDLI